MVAGRGTDVFPAYGRAALDAIDVANDVKSRGHCPFLLFSKADIDAVPSFIDPSSKRQSTIEVKDDTSRETHTKSTRNARPCWPLKA
jgi:hypothetical protein